MKPRILLIGWDAADWRVIHPLIDAGKMPGMARIVNEGVIGNLATLHPVLSPMLWTSIATGKRPFKHGVLGFTEPTPDGQAIRPVAGTSRKTKALWNVFSQQGKTSTVVGWWPTHPAEPIRGVMVSNHYQRAVAALDKPWPLAPGTIHPPRLSETLAELRFHPHEVAAEQLIPFLPNFETMEKEKDKRAFSVAKILAECTSVHAAATHLIRSEPWDFMAVYYDAIDHFCHGFMKYHPPKREAVSEQDFENYKNVVETGYIFHDMMLQVLLKLAGDDTIVMIVSDHGFHPDHRRPDSIPREPAGPAVEHRDFGVIAMMGPGIKRDVQIFGATLLDVTPTLLVAAGLPVGEDMDGKPLLEAFEDPPALRTIPSWDDVPGEAGMHPADFQSDPIASQEAIQQMVELGYIDKPDENREKAVANTTRELRYNLARSYMDAQQHNEAIPILEAIYAEHPDEHRFGANLALCYRAESRIDEMRALVDAMNQRRRDQARDAQKELREWRKKLQERRKERAGAAQAAGGEEAASTPAPAADADAADEADLAAQKTAGLLDEKEMHEIRRLQSLAQLDAPGLEYFKGVVEIADGNDEMALHHLERAAKAQPRRAGLHLQIGEAYLRLKQWDAAQAAYERAAEIDPENAYVQLGFARVALGRRKNRQAAEFALASIGLLFQQPMAHYVLGLALHRMGRLPRAVQALQVAVSLNPNFVEAYERLATLYEKRLGDAEQATEYRRLAAEIRSGVREKVARPALVEEEGRALPERISAEHKAKSATRTNDPFLTIVSGLPRSGTSMMMRMLEAAGLEALTDGQRSADADNPRGYYELEAVKRTRQDASWLEGSEGKAVKMIHMLLPQLPPNRRYRVLMMRRNLDEVLRSQATMLERNQRRGARLDPVTLKETYVKQLAQLDAYLARHPAFRSLDVDYNAVVGGSHDEIRAIIDFLGLACSPESMARVIEADLYRQRSA